MSEADKCHGNSTGRHDFEVGGDRSSGHVHSNDDWQSEQERRIFKNAKQRTAGAIHSSSLIYHLSLWALRDLNPRRFRGIVRVRLRDLRRFPARGHLGRGDCRILQGFHLGARRC